MADEWLFSPRKMASLHSKTGISDGTLILMYAMRTEKTDIVVRVVLGDVDLF